MTHQEMTRRSAIKFAAAAAAATAFPVAIRAESVVRRDFRVAQWDRFEVRLDGPATGNPFVDVTFGAVFANEGHTVSVPGFYDGHGKYVVRFMPGRQGKWTYVTESNVPDLAGHQGTFEAIEPKPNIHGVVSVANTYHFAHADGTACFPFGTTCYAWVHQSEALQEETLKSLKTAPFNKLRMCIFPKSYEYNHNEPPFYPFERSASGVSDWTRPNPAFFAHIEKRLDDVRDLGIEAELILFHPYDRWGYAGMPREADDRYLRYVIARMSSFSNVWWSVANEYDLMKLKTVADFDRFFQIIERDDVYSHPRTIHYSKVKYDYGQPWVTHASLQTSDFDRAPSLRAEWKKPICYDEVQYEGNLNRRWGNISGDELSRRFWLGLIHGCYVTHGETILPSSAAFDENSTPTLWWSHGGILRGTSPRQIAFLKDLVEQTVQPNVMLGLEPQENPYYLNASTYSADKQKAETILYYFDMHQPIWYEFPLPDGEFTAERIDPAACTISPMTGTYSGKSRIVLPARPFQAMRFKRLT